MVGPASASCSYSISQVSSISSPSTSDGSLTNVGSLLVSIDPGTVEMSNKKTLYLNLPDGYKLEVNTGAIRTVGQDSTVGAVYATKQTLNDANLSLTFSNMTPASGASTYQIAIPLQIYVPSGVTGDISLTISAPSSSTYSSGKVVVAKASVPVPTPTTLSPTAQPAPSVIRLPIGSNNYYVNEKMKSMDTAAVISDGRTLLPIRYIATPLGASVDWNESEQKATISLNGKTIELWVNRNTAMINGAETPIDPSNSNMAPIVVPPGRTMLPLRFIAENLGAKVEWDPAQQVVTVTYSQP